MSKTQHWRIGASLSEASRDAILNTFVPAYPNVHANGVTYAYKVPHDFAFPGEILNCTIYGYHRGVGHDALVVALGDCRQKRRPDGKLYHITLSTADGVAPASAGQIDPKAIQTFVFKLGGDFPPFMRLQGPLVLSKGLTFPLQFTRQMLRQGRVERRVA